MDTKRKTCRTSIVAFRSAKVALVHQAGFRGAEGDIGVGYVDYVLWGDDGKPLAVVEAKRTRRDARAGQQLAKLYADCLEAMFGQRPIIFLNAKTWSANQVEFVNLIVNHLTENGTTAPAMLYEPPFTDVTPLGPNGIFTLAHVDRLLTILENLKGTVLAA